MNKYFIIPMILLSGIVWSHVTIAAPLNLSKSDDISEGGCAVSGNDLTYEICYANPNSYEVTDVVLIDALPDNTTFVSVPDGSSGVYDDSTHSVTWDIVSLSQETEETCVQLTINVAALPGTVLINQVTIDSSNEESPPVVDDPTVVEENTEICPVAVYLDIKPGGCPTPINVDSKGVLPVAVLGTKDFDVTTIDPASITLEGVFPLRWEMEDVATPYQINLDECDINDCHELAGDGFVDLTLKFDTQEIYAAIAEVYHRECLLLELTGKLKTAYGDLPIKGGDVVSILRKGSIVPPYSILLKK